VREKLYFLVDLLFKNAGSDYVVISGNHSGTSLHKNDVKSILDYILLNSFAFYGGTFYRQNKGIPQGNNASPQIADLTLAVMEYQYIHNKIKTGHPLAYSLSRTFRYIDDLLHVSSKIESFIEIRKPVLSLYNKTDDYSFQVIRYPHFESNVPVKIGLNTFYGEMVRIYRNCSELNDFILRTESLIAYFLSIQYPRHIIHACITILLKKASHEYL
ncbi:hypothetical protein PFISCL1PPCAC_5826, partial [Pristionchus fissidentatus]